MAKYVLRQPGERQITVTRTFEAPRRLVFDAFTKPEMVKRWLWGPLMPMSPLSLWRRNGRWSIARSTCGWAASCATSGGVFHDIEAPALLVNTEIFDQDWTGGETLVTTTFVEQNGRTTVAATVRYSSPAARDGALKTPMLEGWSQAHDRLDDLLASADARSPR